MTMRVCNGDIRCHRVVANLSKGTDLSAFTQDDLDSIADSLNTRPRATHAFHMPLEGFARMLG